MSISISIFLKDFLSIFFRIAFIDSEFDIDIFQNYQLIDIDIFKNDHINIDIFQKCRYIDNRYSISIYRTGLFSGQARIVMKNCDTVLCDINHQDPEAKGLDQEEFNLISFLSPTTADSKEMKEYW